MGKQKFKKITTQQSGTTVVSQKNINPDSENLKITYLPVQDLKPHPRNARVHPKKQIRQIARSIKDFGFLIPVLIDGKKIIIAGHGRVEAAKLLGMEFIPAICASGLSDAQIRAFMIADNKLTENAVWDDPRLAIEIKELIEIDFDIEVLGFDPPEIDFLIENIGSPEGDSDDDEIPDLPPDASPVSRPGDLFLLCKNLLLCGDAIREESYEHLLGDQRARMVITDPPYNVEINGHARGLGKIRHDDFAMATGEMSEAEFTEFLNGIFRHLVAHTTDGSIHFVFMDWRHLYEIQTAARPIYTELKNLIVWRKTNAGMGSFYRSQHELILVFKNGKAPHLNNFELGQHGRHRSNVWSYPGANAFGINRDNHLQIHPTVKPVALIADAIRDCSRRGDIVLDPFAGSGTIFIAAEMTGRRAYGMELEPRYVDCAIERWERFTRQDAIHAESSLTFSQLKEQRGNE